MNRDGPFPERPVANQTRSIIQTWQHEDAVVLKYKSKVYARQQLALSIRRSQLIHDDSLLPNLELSDFVIVCGEKSFRCHKVIICVQSLVVKEYCRTPLQALRIRFHPLVVQMMLEYLYTCNYHFYLDYNFPTRFQAEGQTVPADYVDRLDCCELSFHLQMHILATRLRIVGLKYLSTYKVLEVLYRSSFATVLPRFAREVYKLITRKNAMMRRAVVGYATRVLGGARSRNHFDRRFPSYILQELPEFAFDLGVECLDQFGCTFFQSESTGYEIEQRQWVC
ncbi:hypothetical protein ARAM_002918 [Aspergillus rambellii]|uniref:BTB domain-containing protein n=1 Tax=Aspergillus rambellii TaxID=308745 RepID=A0A0F8UD62_9EURO|nr:hypothetical protein ARAM_002918 [Aspergillus rambellii]